MDGEGREGFWGTSRHERISIHRSKRSPGHPSLLSLPPHSSHPAHTSHSINVVLPVLLLHLVLLLLLEVRRHEERVLLRQDARAQEPELSLEHRLRLRIHAVHRPVVAHREVLVREEGRGRRGRTTRFRRDRVGAVQRGRGRLLEVGRVREERRLSQLGEGGRRGDLLLGRAGGAGAAVDRVVGGGGGGSGGVGDIDRGGERRRRGEGSHAEPSAELVDLATKIVVLLDESVLLDLPGEESQVTNFQGLGAKRAKTHLSVEDKVEGLVDDDRLGRTLDVSHRRQRFSQSLQGRSRS